MEGIQPGLGLAALRHVVRNAEHLLHSILGAENREVRALEGASGGGHLGYERLAPKRALDQAKNLRMIGVHLRDESPFDGATPLAEGSGGPSHRAENAPVGVESEHNQRSVFEDGIEKCCRREICRLGKPAGGLSKRRGQVGRKA
ncbi:MAG: hypothetical protein Rubg2KO_12070 [Rubricoccaceae bacterium]